LPTTNPFTNATQGIRDFMLKKILILFSLLIILNVFASESEIKSMNEGYVNVPGGKIWYQIHTTKEGQKCLLIN